MLDGMRIEGRTRFDSTTDEPSNRGLLQEETIPANGTSSLLSSWPKFLRLQWRRTFQNRHTFSYSGYDLLEGVGSLRVGGEANFNLSRM